jgi:hypothetical protein
MIRRNPLLALLLGLLLAGPALAGSALRPEIYGAIYEDDDNPVTIALTTAGTYYQWTAATVGLCAGLVGSTDDDSLTVPTNGAGVYLVSFSACFTGSTNTVFTFRVFHTPSGQAKAETHIAQRDRFGTANDLVSLSASGLLRLAAGDKLTLWVTASANSKQVDT